MDAGVDLGIQGWVYGLQEIRGGFKEHRGRRGAFREYRDAWVDSGFRNTETLGWKVDSGNTVIQGWIQGTQKQKRTQGIQGRRVDLENAGTQGWIQGIH